jgi:alcohol dehydrogenase class IV
LPAPKVPHIAVPTTLSGAEFTAVAGITDPTAGEKQMYLDPQLLPRWVVFDSVLAGTCPARLWAGTGMKVVADTIEVLCARRANPQTDALALGALRLLVDHLGVATADPADHVSRGRCQFAVAMVFPQLAAVGVGLVAALRHQLGGGLGIPHGEASTIVLPHVMRYNLAAAAGHYGRAAAALGLATPEALIGRIEGLTAELGLPGRLRATGVARADLDGAVVEHVLTDGGSRANIAPVDAAGVRQILDAAW